MRTKMTNLDCNTFYKSKTSLKLKRFIKLKPRTEIFDDKKTKVKAVPIEDLYPGQLKRIGRVLNGNCPFHNDQHHPNFCIYPETNTWFCFAGCGGGDSINFYMRLKNISFKQALEELSK